MTISPVDLDSSGKAMFGCSIAFGFTATLCVMTRFWLRRNTDAKAGADDWLMLAALVFFYVLIALNNWGVFTVETDPTNIENLAAFQKQIFVAEFFYASSLTAARLGVIFFYTRLFHTKNFRRTAWVIGSLCVCWWIVSCIVDGFACQPIEKFFYPTKNIPGTCIPNFSKYYVAKESIGTGLEAAILAMPIKMVFGLQMSFKRKMMVAGIFMLGGFTVITCAVRAAIVYNPDEYHIDFAKSDIWTIIHLGSAIISACLPTFRPLAVKFAAVTESGRQRYGYLLRSITGRNRSGGSGSSGFSKRTQKGGRGPHGTVGIPGGDMGDKESEASSSRKEILGTAYATQGDHVEEVADGRVHVVKTVGVEVAGSNV